MRIKLLRFVCLLAILLILGSGCIDSSSEPVNETSPINETNPVNETYSQTSSFNSTEEDVSIENSSEKTNNTPKLEGQSSFSKYYSKENL
ncbi:hypothetical protein MSBRW_3285 [Methanosarcina barkeri str. Wiesmoor]|uniref:Lipoprotein n=1 Tax=Methanosarcina barkeri str. Wiesmoor TaxID=1434109 RepID=A0A0E3QPU2_METBA|nr:hypothetical protein [Methanosarcina barkeri]AKB52538.1 hypothetical protein MSBRW_3285 [Methanosarcina barkeri str. Wiesmoor]